MGWVHFDNCCEKRPMPLQGQEALWPRPTVGDVWQCDQCGRLWFVIQEEFMARVRDYAKESEYIHSLQGGRGYNRYTANSFTKEEKHVRLAWSEVPLDEPKPL